MFVDITLAGIQTLLVGLKLTEHINSSWWAVLIPSFVWIVLNIIVTATGKGANED